LTQLVEATKRQAEVSPVGLQVIDTETGLVKHRLELAGEFEVEAISPGGDSLFLIEYLGDKEPPEYAVRIYDLAADSLALNPLRSKTAADEIMAGYAWGGVASPDGRWLLTLYLNTNRQVAFIHALNLVDKFPICLFLPSGAGDFEQLKDYTLTLSADGRQVFAANPSLGVVAEVSLESFETLRQVEFEALLTASKSASAQTAGPTNHSLLSPDGRQLYFSDSTHVWRYDTRRHQVDGPLSIKAQIDGLGVSADGKQLFVATDDGSVRSFHVGAAALTSLQP
jgi:hypothetical protein